MRLVLVFVLSVLLPVGGHAARALFMEANQINTLERMIETVNAGDAAAYARLYAENAVITIYGTATLSGRAAIEQHEVQLMRQYPGATLAFYSVWQQPSRAAVHYAVTANAGGGRSMGHEGLLFFRFDPAGVIVEERRYQDSLTPMAQLGALGATPARPLPVMPSAMKAYAVTGSAAEEKNVLLLREALAAFDSRNAAVLLSMMHEDVRVNELILPQTFSGKATVARWFDGWTTAVPDARTEVNAIFGAGDFVLAETILRGTLRAPLGVLSGSGKAFAVRRGMIAELRDGKLIRLSAFMNGKELAEATGQWPLGR